MFTEEQLQKLQQIYKEELGKEISKEEAIVQGTKLVELHKRILKNINIKISGEENDYF